MAGRELRAGTVTATGALIAGRSRLCAYTITATGDGTAVFRDGGATGTILLTAHVKVGMLPVELPGDGILFDTDIHVTFTGLTASVVGFAA